MNIIDAVKSGRRFYRKGWDTVFGGEGEYVEIDGNFGGYKLSRSDILATDWEVEERKIQITEKELDKVLSETIGKHLAAQIFTDAIKRRLFGER